MPTAIFSTMGTSMLTNGADENLRKMLIRTANLRVDQLATEDRDRIGDRRTDIEALLSQASEQDVRGQSAELNGLLALGPIRGADRHYLLYTDTLQGEACACLAAGWLRQAGGVPIPVKLEHLTVASPEAFAHGVDSLLREIDKLVNEERARESRVVFSLVGGFKALHAYAHTIGMFYADEISYLFEGPGARLIRIPRLPIRVDEGSLQAHAAAVARMAQGEIIASGELEGVPETYLSVDDNGDATLSDWGLLLWLQRRRDLLSDKPLDQPGLLHLDSFRRDYENEKNPDRRVALQEALAKASVLWRSGGLKDLRRDGGLLYEDYANQDAVGHFRISQDIRVSCRPGGSILELRHYGAHDYVNDKP